MTGAKSRPPSTARLPDCAESISENWSFDKGGIVAYRGTEVLLHIDDDQSSFVGPIALTGFTSHADHTVCTPRRREMNDFLCQLRNSPAKRSDSEGLARRVLHNSRFTPFSLSSSADIIIRNLCSHVRSSSVDAANQAKKKGGILTKRKKHHAPSLRLILLPDYINKMKSAI